MNEVSRWMKGNHGLLMVICCAAPMALVAAILVFNIPLGAVGLLVVLLACPLLHLFMMRGMGHGAQNAGCHGGAQAGNTAGKAEAEAEPVGSRVRE